VPGNPRLNNDDVEGVADLKRWRPLRIGLPLQPSWRRGSLSDGQYRLDCCPRSQPDFGKSHAGSRNLHGRRDNIRSTGGGLVGFLIHGPAIEDNAVRWFDLVSHHHRNGDLITETNSGLELQIGAVSAKLRTPAAGIRTAQLA
jgi:hypothetical protein